MARRRESGHSGWQRPTSTLTGVSSSEFNDISFAVDSQGGFEDPPKDQSQLSWILEVEKPGPLPQLASFSSNGWSEEIRQVTPGTRLQEFMTEVNTQFQRLVSKIQTFGVGRPEPVHYQCTDDGLFFNGFINVYPYQ